MPEEVTGQGPDTTIGAITNGSIATPTGQTGELELTKAELAKAREQITRLQGTQASNDRALQALRTEKDKLVAELAEFQTAVTARDTDLEATRQSLTELQTKTAELDTLKAQALAAQAEVERLKVVAEFSASNPTIALLAKTNALPKTETLEEFTAALKTISDGIGVSAVTQATELLSGAKPTPKPADQDADALEAEGYELIARQKDEEGLKLIKKAMALRALKE
jgi:chromosome segregation ATPase